MTKIWRFRYPVLFIAFALLLAITSCQQILGLEEGQKRPGAGAAGPIGGSGGFGGNMNGGSGGAGITGGTGGTAGSTSVGGTGTGGTAIGGAAGAGGGTGGGAGGTISSPSCQGLADTCGPSSNEDCCASALVPGDTFQMGRSENSGDPDYYPSGSGNELPEHSATVAGFYLDKYEVTVGRFRKFVDSGAGTQASPPSSGQGVHPLIGGTGWDSAWNTSLPTDTAGLKNNITCNASYETWTNTAGANENYPINCVNWYEAFAFCIWDGGRLATEAEWEMAAAGGSDNRLYPWGQTAPDVTLANYYDSDYSPFIAVGSHPAGAGRWGHYDLAGSMWEWAFDWYDSNWYSGGGAVCDNCANLTPGSVRVRRGGSWDDFTSSLRAANRDFSDAPFYHDDYVGFRCARTP